MRLILKAAVLAQQAHAGQFRKYTGRPYFEHPARVASRVSLWSGATVEMVAAAYLHDTLEDTDLSVDTIRAVCSEKVAALVVWMTNTSKKDHPELNRAARKALDHARLRGAPREVKVIKMLDRIDNLGEMDGAPKDFLGVYGLESLALADAIGDADPKLMAELVALAEEAVRRSR